MAQLRGKAKEEFLKRMAKGRRKAAKNGPKRKPAKKNTAKRKAPKKAQKKNASPKKLTGKAKQEFLKRMAAGRRKSAKNAGFFSARKSKKRTTAFGAKRAGTEEGKLYRAKAAKTKATKRGRRNSDDSIEAATRKFEEFHGKPAGRVIDYAQAFSYPSNFAEMGKLKELRFALDSANPKFPLTNFRGTQAVCTPDGQNIYFIGGDQEIDFDALDIAGGKDMVELGPCCYICYHTVKGFHDFEPTDYWHVFGEENGVHPILAYDRLNKTLFLLGGDYQVRPEGIVN
jgi:hypothetical protein